MRSSDQGFDDYRKERQRMRAKLGPPARVLGWENNALRELEQVEAKEVRDQQLTREVHEFFSAATRQAANIVERVAKDAQEQAGAKVQTDMEAFLIDALTRMNAFVMSLMHSKRSHVTAETEMEPLVRNIVGASLDGFRFDGSAETAEKHVGQDPFATDVEDVCREFRAQVGDGANAAAAEIEDHLVAEMTRGGPDAGSEDDADEEAGGPQEPVAPTARSMARAAAQPQASPEPSAPPTGGAGDLDRFKEALKALVRQGTMTKDEARAAWQTRLQSVGASPR
jgi:hypothetical protein